MKYFLDTEFIEGPKQRRFLGWPIGRPVPTIDLISIALVRENGDHLYLLNADCELSYAWKNDWVRNNVLAKIYTEHISGDQRNAYRFSLATMRYIFAHQGDHRAELVQQIMEFLGFFQHSLAGIGPVNEYRHNLRAEHLPEFYGYYADYDWVVFCQLFGTMDQLPKGMPMYCLDLMQDLRRIGLNKKLLDKYVPQHPTGEHNALDDARWNRDAHEFMNNFWAQMDESDRKAHSNKSYKNG